MSETKIARPLSGRGIVVTRPAHQAADLVELIAAAGGYAILFPTIEIVAVSESQALTELIDRLDTFDIAIFVSPNAVSQAMRLIRARRELPPRLALATIGRGGVRELERYGATRVAAPARFDSEALLDLPEMREVAGKRIVIFGRELLGDTLTARGAAIEYAQCYRRTRPHVDATPLLKAWERNDLHAITATSSDGLRNLVELVGKSASPWLRQTPLFVPHPRIEHAARELGFATVVLTAQGDAGLVRGLTQWFAGAR
jgi:uroporphyrinogen-III synthase